MNFSTTDIAKSAGVTVRTIQHWCDLGIVQPTHTTQHQGRGNKREITEQERDLALITASAARWGLPQGVLRVITAHFRTDEDAKAAIAHAKSGKLTLCVLTYTDVDVEYFRWYDSARIELPKMFGLLLNLKEILSDAR